MTSRKIRSTYVRRESVRFSFWASGNIPISGTMSTKKRKLPRDLSEAEAVVLSEKTAEKTLAEAYNSLTTVHISNIYRLKQIPEEQIVTWLIATCGLSRMKRICSILGSLPPTLTSTQRKRFLESFLDTSEDVALICKLVEEKCPTLELLKDPATTPGSIKILAPPVHQCFKCTGNLSGNHQCAVTLYTMRGVYTADKVTLRCTRCSITYNYAMWGNKHSEGFVYYDEPRDYIEVSDTVYFDRKVLDMQCSLA